MKVNRKITISLPEHVYQLGLKQSKIITGSNFSSYINSLVCGEFSKEELEKEYTELSKPIYSGNIKKAGKITLCEFCRCIINPEDIICRARFENNQELWVHQSCCRK